MRFNNKNSVKTSLYFLKKREFRNILMKTLGLNATDFEDVIDTNKNNIFNIPRHQMIKNCSIYEKYNVNAKPLVYLSSCLKLKDYNLEHKINMLKDIGVSKLDSYLVAKILSLSKLHVSMFKEITNLSDEHNIAENIFAKLGDKVPNEISQLEYNDKLTIHEYYKACLLYCKNQIFDLSYLDDKVLLNSYLYFKSISMIAETLKILRIDLGFDEKMIKKDPYILHASANNIRLLLNNFTEICGLPISTVLRKRPYMMFQDVNNIKCLLTSFKKYNIPEEYAKKYMTIFKMDNDTFLERIEKLKRHPDAVLRLWYTYPRILKILNHVNTVDDRIKYLNVMNRAKWANPNIILATKTKIDRFVQNDSSMTVYKKPMKYILVKELGMEVSQKLGIDICDLLLRHQYWKTVALIDIQNMLQYLKKNFTISEICQNIHIILYAQSRVEAILVDLKRQYSNSTQYSFTNGQYLALCLYMLEKDTHFTGDGIWNNGHNARQKFSHLKDESVTETLANDINNNLNSDDDVDDVDDDIDHIRLDDGNKISSTAKQQYT